MKLKLLKIFIILKKILKHTLYCTNKKHNIKTVIQLVAMEGLSLKEISSSQPTDVQYNKYTYHSHFIPEEAVEASQIFLQDVVFPNY
jgi:hypothetical protein